MKQAAGAGARLLPEQHAVIALNRALVALRMGGKAGDIAAAKQQLRDARERLAPSDADDARATLDEAEALIAAAEADASGARDKVRAALSSLVDKQPDAARARTLLAQEKLAAGDASGAAAELQRVPRLEQRPALVGAVATLLERANGTDAAAAFVIELCAKRDVADGVLRGSGAFLLARARASDAVPLFDALLKRNKRDADALAHLIDACAQCDPARAAELLERLPPLPAPPADFDVEKELADTASATRLANMAAEVTGGSAASAAAAAAAKADAERLAKKRARRKARRKPRYPQGFDPAHPENFPKPDPERWIPKRMRKANQKAGARGAQGGGEVDDMKGGAKLHRVAGDTKAAPKKKPPAKNKGGGGKKKGKKGKRR